MTEAGSDEFWSFEEVLSRLDIDATQLTRLVSGGEIRAFRDGERMSFKRDEIEKLVEAGVPSTVPAHTSEILLESAGVARFPSPDARAQPARPAGDSRLRAISAERMHALGGAPMSTPQSVLPWALLSGVVGAAVMCLAAYAFGWVGDSGEAPAAPPADDARYAALASKLDGKLDAQALRGQLDKLQAALRTDSEQHLSKLVEDEIAARIQAVGGEDRTIVEQLEQEIAGAVDAKLKALEQTLVARGERSAEAAAAETAAAAALARNQLASSLERAIAERPTVDLSEQQLAAAVEAAVSSRLSRIVSTAVEAEVARRVGAGVDRRIATARRDFGNELKAAATERATLRFALQRATEALTRAAAAAPKEPDPVAGLQTRISALEARLEAVGAPDQPMGADPAPEPAAAGPSALEAVDASDCRPVRRARRCLPWPFGR